MAKCISIEPDEKFYAASGPYRSLCSSPDYIIGVFDTYEDAYTYTKWMSITEDGKSVYVLREREWVEIVLFEDGYHELRRFNVDNYQESLRWLLND